jgi:hypothetical protein
MAFMIDRLDHLVLTVEDPERTGAVGKLPSDISATGMTM